MLAFRSEGHLERWLTQRDFERGSAFGLAACWGLAEGWYADRLRSEWRRRTPAEAEELFESLGLTGPFWRFGG